MEVRQRDRYSSHLKPTIFNLQELSGSPSSAVKSNIQTEQNKTSLLGLHNREEPLYVSYVGYASYWKPRNKTSFLGLHNKAEPLHVGYAGTLEASKLGVFKACVTE